MKSSKITIMSDTTCVQLHHRPITSASNYNRITLGYDHEQDFIRNIMLVHVLVWPAELESSGGGAASDSWEIKWDGCKQFVRCEMQLRWASQSSAVWDAGRCVYIAADGCKLEMQPQHGPGSPHPQWPPTSAASASICEMHFLMCTASILCILYYSCSLSSSQRIIKKCHTRLCLPRVFAITWGCADM